MSRPSTWILVLTPPVSGDAVGLFGDRQSIAFVHATLPHLDVRASWTGAHADPAAIVLIARTEDERGRTAVELAAIWPDDVPVFAHVAENGPVRLHEARDALLEISEFTALIGPEIQPLPAAAAPPMVAETGSPSVGPARRGRPSTPSATSDEIMSGRVRYTAPDTMNVGETDRVDVRIARGDVVDEILRAGLDERHRERIETIPTTTRMSVEVTSSSPDHLAVTPLSPPAQWVDVDHPATWQFDVRAIRVGRHSLRLSLRCEVDVDGETLIHSPPVIERDVEVRVAAGPMVGRWWLAHWKWAIATLITVSGAAAAWFALLSG